MENLSEIILACIGVLGAFLGYLAQKHAKEANKAVNGNKNPSAIRLYDMVLGMDERAERLESWMLRHKGESAERNEDIAEQGISIIDIKNDIVKLGQDVTRKIEEYGCPVRLGVSLTPLCENHENPPNAFVD